jgi:hypothetical protein
MLGDEVNPSLDTTDDLKKVLEEFGYSASAIAEILKWYLPKENPA